MTNEVTKALIEAAALIIPSFGALIVVIFRVIGKRFERREKERVIEYERKQKDWERKQEEAKAKFASDLATLQLERERDRDMLQSVHAAHEHNGKLVDAILEQTGTLKDFGRVLSANSSVLVGNTESLGELVERTGTVVTDVGKLNETVKKIESAVNAIKASIGDTGDVSLTERISQLQRLVLELNTKPLQVVPPSEPKTETPAA